MLPEPFLTRMQRLLGEDYSAFTASFEQDAVRALRVNTCKISEAALREALGETLTPLSYAADGFVFDAEGIGNHPLHHSGAFYVQDPGAMATLHAIEIQKGWRVADFCAAPGGKSSQLSAYIGEDGFLLSNEINHARCKTLAGNLERLGCRNALLTNTDSASIASWFSAYFDLVLVDAPCSGEGMFRKHEHAVTEWSEENVLACAKKQSEILDHAAKTVADGGYLLYSTCTFSLEENECNVDAFLTRHPAFEVVEVSASLKAATADGIAFEGASHPEALRMTRRFYPHVSMGEGQYIALMRKKGEGDSARVLYKDTAQSLSKDDRRIVEAFLKDVLTPEGCKQMLADGVLFKHKENVFIRSHRLPVPPYGVYMPGVALGALVKGRVEVHHQFFSAYGRDFVRRLELRADDVRVSRYLRGETIECDLPNGYAVLLVHGCALGGVKVVNGIAKNHYPKGLRLH